MNRAGWATVVGLLVVAFLVGVVLLANALPRHDFRKPAFRLQSGCVTIPYSSGYTQDLALWSLDGSRYLNLGANQGPPVMMDCLSPYALPISNQYALRVYYVNDGGGGVMQNDERDVFLLYNAVSDPSGKSGKALALGSSGSITPASRNNSSKCQWIKVLVDGASSSASVCIGQPIALVFDACGSGYYQIVYDEFIGVSTTAISSLSNVQPNFVLYPPLSSTPSFGSFVLTYSPPAKGCKASQGGCSYAVSFQGQQACSGQDVACPVTIDWAWASVYPTVITAQNASGSTPTAYSLDTGPGPTAIWAPTFQTTTGASIAVGSAANPFRLVWNSVDASGGLYVSSVDPTRTYDNVTDPANYTINVTDASGNLVGVCVIAGQQVFLNVQSMTAAYGSDWCEVTAVFGTSQLPSSAVFQAGDSVGIQMIYYDPYYPADAQPAFPMFSATLQL